VWARSSATLVYMRGVRGGEQEWGHVAMGAAPLRGKHQEGKLGAEANSRLGHFVFLFSLFFCPLEVLLNFKGNFSKALIR
jgi:hypothetical protein